MLTPEDIIYFVIADRFRVRHLANNEGGSTRAMLSALMEARPRPCLIEPHKVPLPVASNPAADLIALATTFIVCVSLNRLEGFVVKA